MFTWIFVIRYSQSERENEVPRRVEGVIELALPDD